MSAIIKGKCSKCQGTYHIDLGNTKWFSDRMEKNRDNPIFDSYEQLRKSGLCPNCGKHHYARFASEWRKNSTPPAEFSVEGRPTQKRELKNANSSHQRRSQRKAKGVDRHRVKELS